MRLSLRKPSPKTCPAIFITLDPKLDIAVDKNNADNPGFIPLSEEDLSFDRKSLR